MLETNVTFNIQFLPAFSARAQFHLAPQPPDKAQDDELEERKAPASVVPTTDFTISPAMSRVFLLQ